VAKGGVEYPGKYKQTVSLELCDLVFCKDGDLMQIL
jgi:hypothetical protein